MDLEHQHDLLAPACRRPRGPRGFSLVEVLIASAIFLIVALGIVPFFTQAIVNNRAGADYTQSTNYAKSELERLFSLPITSPDLQVTAGLEAVKVEYFSQASHTWVPTITGSDVALWTRTVTIRQFGIAGLLAGGAAADALPAGTPAGEVPARQIEVRVQSGRAGGPLGAGKQITLSLLKGF